MKIFACGQVGLLLAALLMSAAAQAVTSVNKSISIPDGGHEDSVSSVNGSITVGERASVGSIRNVNGAIKLGDNAMAESIESVNGGVRMGEGVQVKFGVRIVNGNFDMASGSQVGGDVKTVNGSVHMDHAVIEGTLHSASASIQTGVGSEIRGGIYVEKRSRGDNSRPPEITIGPDSRVGDITAERDIVLRISRKALVGQIDGATAIWTE